MNLRLQHKESIRIVGDCKENNFIDVSGVGYESLAIDLFGTFQYIEIRKKETQLRVFTFIKKSYKKECDFGWWEDAEVVYSLNLNGKDEKCQ